MSRIGNVFRDHPASVGETYLGHMRSALGFSFAMARAAVCCAIHGLLPFLFQKTGSRAIDDLHRRMVRERSNPRDHVPTSTPARHQTSQSVPRTAA